MKRILQLCLLLFAFLGVAAQNKLKPIAKEINDFKSRRVEFKKVSPFTLDIATKHVKYELAAKDAKALKLRKEQLSSIIADKPVGLSMTFPFENRELEVELIKVDIYSPDFKVSTNIREVNNYQKGVFYRGIIKGDNSSVVAFSFFEDDIIAVASSPKIGNVVLGKAVNSNDYVVYNDQKMTGTNPFICKVDEMMENEVEKISFNPSVKVPEQTESCVRVYYEICYAPFVQNGSDVETTTNWISAIHNNINTLYVNDGVKMALKTVYIWESADPYTGGYRANLESFRLNRQSFDGDLAHLVNYPATTSVAYLNSLCSTYKYAYSGINKTYENVPSYSWTIMAMTHEMGHSLGSPHTHACAWNGDNTAIDGCGPAWGNDEGCDGPIPTNGGTIMSYCHGVSGVGINFANGFGEQPGALIRKTVDAKACLGSDCTNACPVTISSMVISEVVGTSAKVTITDAVSTEWKYRVMKMDGTIVFENVTTSKVFNIENLDPNQFYRIETGTDCSPAYQRSSIVLAGDDWCGKTITDTGGFDANYSDNENWSKTLYPTSPNDKVRITFEEFDLEQSYDFLTVRNGPAINSPVFSGGLNLSGSTLPPSFESTHATGAITIVFKSDEAVNLSGFKANLSCRVLGVDDINSKNKFSISPNPVKNQFRLNDIQTVEKVFIYDVTGKLVKEFGKESVSKNSFDISKLKTGNYVVTIKTSNNTISTKLIKE